MKNSEDAWNTTAEGKCKLFLNTLTGKYKLPVEEYNEYTDLEEVEEHTVCNFLPVRTRLVKRHLKKLKEDKATGPDLLSGRVPKKCAEEVEEDMGEGHSERRFPFV